MHFFLLLCLGRPARHDGETHKRVGASIFGTCKSMLASTEFARNMLEPLSLGKLPVWRPYNTKERTLLAWGLKEHFGVEGTPPSTWRQALVAVSQSARFLQIFDAAENGYQAEWFFRRLPEGGASTGRTLLGQVDEYVGSTLRGYVLDLDDTSAAITLDLFVNGTFTGQATPTECRRDLQERYGGSGRYVFQQTLEIPAHLRSHKLLVLTAYDHASGQLALPAFEFAPMKARHRDEIAKLTDELAALNKNIKTGDIGAAANSEIAAQLARIEAALPELADRTSFSLDDYEEYLACYPHSPSPKYTSAPSVAVCYMADTPLSGESSEIVSLETLAVTQADYIAFIPAGASLGDHAAAWLATTAAENPEADILFADYDYLGEAGQRRLCCRAAFDSDLLLQDPAYACAFAAKRDVALRFAGEEKSFYALWLMLLREKGPRAFAHVPRILWHFQAAPAFETKACQHDLANYLQETVPHAKISAHKDTYGGAVTSAFTTEWPIDEKLPKLAVIIPTRDQLDLLTGCIESLRATLAYPHATEIIVVDNGSQDTATQIWLEGAAKAGIITLVQHKAPFNWSELNNLAANKTDAEYLLFLNDDTKALDKGWDHILRGYLARGEIGAVGARLLYADGTIQHGGVIINQLQQVTSDAIIHEASGESPDEGGYMHRSQLAHSASAVTGAFLACKRTDFEAVGGFDAVHFAVAFNDIDFCLRLGAKGKSILYVPQLTFFHFESKSRGYDGVSPEKSARVEKEHKSMIKKWSSRFPSDPWYPELFLRKGKAFSKIAAPQKAKA